MKKISVHFPLAMITVMDLKQVKINHCEVKVSTNYHGNYKMVNIVYYFLCQSPRITQKE